MQNLVRYRKIARMNCLTFFAPALALWYNTNFFVFNLVHEPDNREFFSRIDELIARQRGAPSRLSEFSSNFSAYFPKIIDDTERGLFPVNKQASPYSLQRGTRSRGQLNSTSFIWLVLFGSNERLQFTIDEIFFLKDQSAVLKQRRCSVWRNEHE